MQTRFGHWYTGITVDVARRLATHQAGKGAKNLKGKGPLVLIHQQQVGTKSDASKLEYAIKKLPRAKSVTNARPIPSWYRYLITPVARVVLAMPRALATR